MCQALITLDYPLSVVCACRARHGQRVCVCAEAGDKASFLFSHSAQSARIQLLTFFGQSRACVLCAGAFGHEQCAVIKSISALLRLFFVGVTVCVVLELQTATAR